MPRGTVYRYEVVNTPSPIEGTPSNSLVASAKTYAPGGGPGAQKLRQVGRRTRRSEWQNSLWDMYDQVPEFRSGCSYVGNLLSKAILYAVGKDGKPATDPLVLDAMASLFGGTEGQEEMLRLLGVNFTVAGEAFIIGTPAKDPNDDDDWMVVASVEVQGETTGNMTVEGEPIDPNALPIRLWKAHPRSSIDSDCPARALLPTLSEIVRLNQVVASQADSRLKGNGILFVPSELEMPAMPVTTLDVSDEEMQSVQQADGISEGLTQRMIKIASIAMRDRDSAAAGIPLVIAAPGEFLEKVQWIDFWTGFDEYTQKLREEARKTVGVGMDMPPEVITGTADMNHWSSWQTDEAAIKIHSEPLLAVIVSSLTQGYLHPILRAWNVEDWQDYSIEANTAAMRLRPNRSQEAFELWDRGEISGRTLLIENGFDPDSDAPDQKERMTWFLSQLARKTSASPDQLAAALAKLGLTGIPSDAGGQQRGEMPQPSLEQHPTVDIPDPADSEAIAASAAVVPIAPFVVDAILLAAEQSIFRALERSGNKLKSQIGSGTVTSRARDLYLQVPRLPVSDCMRLLDDAWSSLDGVTYPGIEMHRYRSALQQYALTLLRTQAPYDRGSLARHLMLELADEAA
jgi:hypothetical protein